jgi:hypothetical protein
MRHPVVRHLVLPAVAPLAVIGLYFTPVLVFGCVNVGIALVSAVGAFVAIGMAFRLRARGEPAGLWIGSALILTSPLALLVGPLG